MSRCAVSKLECLLAAEAKFEHLLCINKKVKGERDNTPGVCEKKGNERESQKVKNFGTKQLNSRTIACESLKNQTHVCLNASNFHQTGTKFF